jgi:UDP-glucose 4-epimerase
VKILITGAAGFIGSHVASAYVAAGHHVVAVDNLSSGDAANLPDGVRLHRVDLRRPRALDAALRAERPEVVNHHAANADVSAMTRRPRAGMDVNFMATLALLESCLRHAVGKLIFVSSAAVYGDPRTLPVDEAHPLDPICVYGASKAAGEMIVRVFGRNAGLRYTVMRYANVYGPRQVARAEGGVVASFLDALDHGRPPIVTWDGEQTRDFVFVSDVACANLAAVERGDGGAYNVGTGKATSINALLRATETISGRHVPPQRVPKREGDIRSSYFDVRLAERDLGWRASTVLEEGLRLLVEWRARRRVDRR